MFRGISTFICDNCGRKFKGLNIEWKATIFATPQQCPICLSYHTRPTSLFGLNKSVYREIWKQMDEILKNS